MFALSVILVHIAGRRGLVREGSMAKQQKKRTLSERLRDFLTELDRLLNPAQPVPARVPVRGRPR